MNQFTFLNAKRKQTITNLLELKIQMEGGEFRRNV